MANSAMNPSEVKSTCDKLECSPSANSQPAKSGGTAKLIRNSGGGAAGGGSTSEFKMERKSGKIPGYTGGFAKKAEQA